MSNVDNIFWQRFGLILGLLVVFGFIVAFIARDIAGDAFEATVSRPDAIAKRIAPAGSVRVGDPTAVVAAVEVVVAAAPASAPAADAAVDGEAVYGGACVACHLAGIAGAPKLGDEAAWAPRIALGEDALVMSVVNGKGAMPANGGNPALSEEQLRAAVQYMLGKSGGTGATSQTMEKLEQVAGAAPAAVTDTASQVTEKASAATTDAAGSAGAAAMTAAAPSASDGEAAGKPGDQVYNMGCVACHATGVANAPKLNDKAAWETRAGAGGVAALVASVLNGKGAMPAKGGIASLTEADLSNAVRYMLEEAGVDAGG